MTNIPRRSRKKSTRLLQTDVKCNKRVAPQLIVTNTTKRSCSTQRGVAPQHARLKFLKRKGYYLSLDSWNNVLSWLSRPELGNHFHDIRNTHPLTCSSSSLRACPCVSGEGEGRGILNFRIIPEVVGWWVVRLGVVDERVPRSAASPSLAFVGDFV